MVEISKSKIVKAENEVLIKTIAIQKREFLSLSNYGIIQGFWSLNPTPLDNNGENVKSTKKNGFMRFDSYADFKTQLLALLKEDMMFFAGMRPKKELGKWSFFIIDLDLLSLIINYFNLEYLLKTSSVNFEYTILSKNTEPNFSLDINTKALKSKS